MNFEGAALLPTLCHFLLSVNLTNEVFYDSSIRLTKENFSSITFLWNRHELWLIKEHENVSPSLHPSHQRRETHPFTPLKRGFPLYSCG
jgi:hypothetical protein